MGIFNLLIQWFSQQWFFIVWNTLCIWRARFFFVLLPCVFFWPTIQNLAEINVVIAWKCLNYQLLLRTSVESPKRCTSFAPQTLNCVFVWFPAPLNRKSKWLRSTAKFCCKRLDSLASASKGNKSVAGYRIDGNSFRHPSSKICFWDQATSPKKVKRRSKQSAAPRSFGLKKSRSRLPMQQKPPSVAVRIIFACSERYRHFWVRRKCSSSLSALGFCLLALCFGYSVCPRIRSDKHWWTSGKDSDHYLG